MLFRTSLHHSEDTAKWCLKEHSQASNQLKRTYILGLFYTETFRHAPFQEVQNKQTQKLHRLFLSAPQLDFLFLYVSFIHSGMVREEEELESEVGRGRRKRGGRAQLFGSSLSFSDALWSFSFLPPISASPCSNV